MLLKDRIRSLWEKILSFKRSSHFECLYRVNNNQQATGDQHSDVILGLTFFFTSFFKRTTYAASNLNIIVNIKDNCDIFSECS